MIDVNFRKKLLPKDEAWIILNNLQQFNGTEQVEIIIRKLSELEDHAILGTFLELFKEAHDCYKELGSYPDMDWMIVNFKKSRDLQKVDTAYSNMILEDFNKVLDREILKQRIEDKIINTDSPSTEVFRDLSTEMARYAEQVTEQSKLTKDDILSLYDNYKKEYKGVKTMITAYDSVVGCFPQKSVVTIVAPSGHGKSTFAQSVSYNIAIGSGMVVDYISFEMPKEQVWFNLCSMETIEEGTPVEATKIKEALLSKDEEDVCRSAMKTLLAKLNESDGYINVIDATEGKISTFEDLCSHLETIAEERGRAADLIVVDNVDNLRVLKSPEKNTVEKVNQYIIGFDEFSKKYCKGNGTVIMLLSQTNRTAIKKLSDYGKQDDKEKKLNIDMSCIQMYNSLYERSTNVTVLFADKATIANKHVEVMPVKLRNRPLPSDPIILGADYAYSRVFANIEEKEEQEFETLDSYQTYDLNKDEIFIDDDEDEDFDDEDFDDED